MDYLNSDELFYLKNIVDNEEHSDVYRFERCRDIAEECHFTGDDEEACDYARKACFYAYSGEVGIKEKFKVLDAVIASTDKLRSIGSHSLAYIEFASALKLFSIANTPGYSFPAINTKLIFKKS